MDWSWFLDGSHDQNVAPVDFSGVAITYAELRERASVWTERLLHAAKGESLLVALEFEDSSEAVSAYLGVLKSGLPVLLLEPGQLQPDSRIAVVWRPEIHIATGPEGEVALHLRAPHAEGSQIGTPDAHPDLAVLSTLGTIREGGKLDPESVRHSHALGQSAGWHLVVMHGQTEAAPRISWLPPSALPETADTTGRAIPGGRIRALDENGAGITEPGRPGELTHDRSDGMMGHAESRPDLARGVEVTELRTGDIAERTAEGFFRIVGRMKRSARIAGLRLGLDQIEAMLQGKGLAAQAVAVDDRLVLLHAEAGAGGSTRDAVAEAYGHPLSEVRVGHLSEMPLLASRLAHLTTVSGVFGYGKRHA
jgi:acyl-coenzyme A synthetase/AMP-(fatty) acid ligase